MLKLLIFFPLERKTFPSKKSESEIARSSLTLCEPMDCSQPGSSVHGIFPGKNTGVGCNFLIQGLLLIQGSNLGLPHCRQTLYHLNHQGISFLLKVVPFWNNTQSNGQRNETSALAIWRTICRLLPTAEVMRKGLSCLFCGSIYGIYLSNQYGLLYPKKPMKSVGSTVAKSSTFSQTRRPPWPILLFPPVPRLCFCFCFIENWGEEEDEGVNWVACGQLKRKWGIK